MQKLTKERIDVLLSQVSQILNDEKVPCLVYGSYAYSYYLKVKGCLCNDIDIIVKQKDFKKIEELFSKYNMPYKLYLSEHTIHANHITEVGNDGKPFDISFDSYEYYFLKHGIDINIFFKERLSDGVEISLIKKDDLIKIYELGVGSANNKGVEYLKKLNKLKSKSSF